ncbi:Usp1 [Desulforapulum autotrophicum HRM2]|uniref:Usp1 n=1 Tax=Desulforapulum autotrophicum (strain ATCC 43914 / DSM 3382 / VKM B-1955 / HRM2) TaxID=177437 RepID=C0QMA4_DESAH|nr:universal stress protein [Desulforapulum autotrophicum]ACN16421.1 Usp1 [Desulforapulum autotrophicum HRM2]
MRIHPQRIMCAVDFSDFTDTILSYSIALSKEFHAKLFLIHVAVEVEPLLKSSEIAIDVEALQAKHMEKAFNRLKAFVKETETPHEILVTKGNPADKIRDLALEHKVDMVITATHGNSGIKRFMLGSVTEKLIKTIHCPLLVLNTRKFDIASPAPHGIELKRILVGCDFSQDSKLAFDYGLSLAQEFQAELYLAHVVKPTEHLHLKASDYIDVAPADYVKWRSSDYFEMQKRSLDEKREKFDKLRGNLERQLYFMVPEESRNWCTPKTILLDGEPYKELISYAQEKKIDMIVLGIRGHTLWEKLMVGSTTDRIIRQSPCPVLAVRPLNPKKQTSEK